MRIKSSLAFLVACAALFAVKAGENIPEPRRLQIPEEKVVFYRLSKAPVLDGDISDDVWAGVPVFTDFKLTQLIGNKHDGDRTPPMRTEAKLGFDRHKMYFAFRCYDPDAKALPPGTKPEGWEKDHMTMFFAPRRPDSNMQQATYYATAVKHLSYRGKAPEKPFRSTWGQMRCAVRFYDGYWQMEAEVPFANLKFNPEKDHGMRGQIAREMSRVKPEAVCAMAGDAFHNMFEYNAFRDFEYTSFPLHVRLENPAQPLHPGRNQVKVVLRNNSSVARPGRVEIINEGPKKRYNRSGLFSIKPGQEIVVTMNIDVQDQDTGISLLARSKEGYIHYNSGVLKFENPAVGVRKSRLMEMFSRIDGGKSAMIDMWRRELSAIPETQSVEAWNRLNERLTGLEDAANNWLIAKQRDCILPGNDKFFLTVFSSLEKVREMRRLSARRSSANSIILNGAAGETVNFQTAAVAIGDQPVAIQTVTASGGFAARIFRVDEVESNQQGIWPDKLSRRIPRTLSPQRRIGVWWVSITIPRNTKAGSYTGRVKVSAADGSSAEIPYTVNVRNFALPVKSAKMANLAQIAPIMAAEATGADPLDCYRMLANLTMEYGLTPVVSTEGARRMGLRDWKLYENFEEIAGRFGILVLPSLPWFHEVDRYLKDFAEAQDKGKTRSDFLNEITADYDDALAKIRTSGLSDITYIYYDEVNMRQKEVLEYLIGLKQRTGFKLITCFDKSFSGYDYVKYYAEPVDMLFFNSSFFIDPLWYEQLQDLQKNGKKIGWYLNKQSGFPTFNRIPVEAIDHRMHYFKAYRYKIDATLLWGVNWYSEQQFNRQPIPRIPGDGNGCLTYPEDGIIVPSIRLELLRESFQDYLYLEMLEMLAAEFPDTPEAAQSRELLQLKWIGETLTDLPDDSRILLHQREMIAGCIEKLLAYRNK